MTDPYENIEPVGDPDVPTWDDEYVDRVSDRLMFNYDLEKDYRVHGEPFTLYGAMEMQSEKHFFHPALSYAHHEAYEHLFVRRMDPVTIAALEDLVALGHDLAAEWIEPDERHFSTEFTFVVLAQVIPDGVGSFVESFRDRNLLKYGFIGHYEIHLVVVAPDAERIVSSEEAHVEEAFRLWEPIERKEPGLWDLITRRLQI